MKKTASLLWILLSANFFAGAQEAQPASKENVRKLPSVEIKTTEAKSVNTNTFSNDGKPIVICFWATWCKPCVEELNAIAENYDEWKKETGVKVIAMSVDDSRTIPRVGPFANGKNWDYEVYVDPNGDFKRAMNVNNPPHSFVLNGAKEIKWQHIAYAPGDEKKLFEAVKKVAKGENPSE